MSLAFVFLSFVVARNSNQQQNDKYDKRWPYSEGYARVMRMESLNGNLIPLYGFIDKSGKEVIPLIYDYAEDFSCGIALVGYLTKAKYNADNVTLILQPRFTYINKSGKELDYSFYFASSANKERASVLIGVPFIPYGIANSNRLDKVKWQYKEIRISDLLVHSGHQDELNLRIPFEDWGSAKDNTARFAASYKLTYKFSTCYVRDYYMHKEDLVNFKEKTDDKEHEFKEEMISDAFCVVCQHGLCGVRDVKSGNLLIPCAFGDVVYLGKDKFAVEYKEKWAIVNSQMKYLTDFIYDKVKTTGRESDISDLEHWIFTGTVKDTYTYEWGYKYNYNWLSVDINKIQVK